MVSSIPQVDQVATKATSMVWYSILCIPSWVQSMPVPKLVPTAILLLSLALLYFISLGLYRLYWHPLANFPGPKLAAFTQWYEFYFDIIKDGGGMFTWEIERMHRQYGPIVRITPHEIHVSDPDWYEMLYAGPTQQREKYPLVAKMVATPLGVFGAVSHHDHRKRRQVISPFFSKKVAILKEPGLRQKVDLFCRTLQSQATTDGVVNVRPVYLGLATDVVCSSTLGSSPHPELLLDPHWQKEWQATLHAMEQVIPFIKQIPWALKIALKLPSWSLQRPLPSLARLVVLHENMQVMAESELSRSGPSDAANTEKATSTNIFQTVLSSDRPPSEKTVMHLTHQGLELISAGGETTARVMSAATYHLLANPDMLQRLRGEIDPIFDTCDPVTVKDLEALPYLTAVIKESLRCGAVVLTRFPLVSPNKPLQYQDWTIPPGTAVSMTPARIMHDPFCYDDSHRFNPDRWLGAKADVKKAERYFFAFSRGGRNCLGMNLAWAELYLTIATVFHRYDLALFDTIRERDVDHRRDLFMGRPSKEEKGIRVTLQPRQMT